ncbi:efflux transporter outer membrane subunit [Frateuria aurantia]
MRVIKTVLLGVMASSLAACVSTRGLHPSGQLTTPEQVKAEHSLEEVKLTPAAWPTTDWWVALGDPQLTALINEALRDNPGLAEADALARQAQAEAARYDAERGPSLTASGGMTGARLSEKEAGLVLPQVTGTFAWVKQAGLNFSWDIDVWGGRRDAWQAAVGRDRAAEIDRRAARIALSVNITRAYLQLAQAFAYKDIAEADLVRSNRVRDLTRTYIEGGLGDPQSIHQVSTEAGQAEQEVAEADEAIDAARTALSVLLGKGPDRGLEIARPLPLRPGALEVPNDLAAGLLGRRPDLVAARWRVEAAALDVKSYKTQFLPNISLTAMAGLFALGDNVNLFQLPARTYNVAPAISLPIFDAGSLRAGLRSSDAAYDQAVAQYNQTLIKAVNQVSDLLSSLRSDQIQIRVQRQVVVNAQRSWDDAMTRYKVGLAPEMDTLIIRQQLLNAERTMAALVRQQGDVSVRLIDALGGGFHDEEGLAAATAASSPKDRAKL